MSNNIQEDAEDRAVEIRRMFGVDSLRWIDVQTVLCKLRVVYPDISWCRVDDANMPRALAQWDSYNRTIKIRETTYCAANYPTQDGRARWSIFHEIIHAVEKHEGVLNRAHTRVNIPRFARKLRKIESHTDRITAAFIAPQKFISSSMTAQSLGETFGMSHEAATIRIQEVRKTRAVPILIESIWDSQISGYVIHHGYWIGGQDHGETLFQ